MIDHAEIITWLHRLDSDQGWEVAACQDALAALNALQAENQRLRDALEQIIEVPVGPWRDFFTAGITIARKALDDTTASPLPPPSGTHMVRSGLAQIVKPRSTKDST